MKGEHLDPGPAALRGLVRVLAYEHPELRPTWVDLDPDTPGTEDLLRELSAHGRSAHGRSAHGRSAPDLEDEVAWRAGRRHVARLVRPRLGDDTSRPVGSSGATAPIS